MSLAFWRRKRSTPDAPGSGSSPTANGDDARVDPSAAMRARARRRLIGAAALLLMVIIVVPMVLDPEPKPLADNIPIDIPSEKTKFSPRLALPPVPAPENVPLAPPADAPPPAAPATAASPTKSNEGKGEDAKPAKATAAPKSEDRSGSATDAKSAGEKLPAPMKGGKFAVQAAATATEPPARELAERLKKAGLSPYTERIETSEGTRYRVRVGPYASREDAERVRARLKTLGVNANVVAS